MIRYMPHIVGHGPRVLEHARSIHAEGIVCKRLAAPHRPGRSRDWLKCKCVQTKPFVVGGFTHSGQRLMAVSALLVGHYDAQGQLHYAGDVGTGQGFTREFLQELYRQLLKLEQPRSPFVRYEPTGIRSAWNKGAVLPVSWVAPLAVADIDHLELTNNGRLRHPSLPTFPSGLGPSGCAPRRVRQRALGRSLLSSCGQGTIIISVASRGAFCARFLTAQRHQATERRA